MWPKLWNSAKKVCPWWATVFGLTLGFWPLPADWNASITINLRLMFAFLMFVGLIIWMFIDFSTAVYRSTLCFEEKVQQTEPIAREDGKKNYQVFINYNPAYKSMTTATVYLRTSRIGVDPVYQRLCNGKVINLKEDAATKIWCVPNAELSDEKLRILHSELTCLTRSDHKELVVLPFFEEEDS